MPRVLQVLQPESGGVPVHVLALSLGLKARGWALEVATCATSVIASPLATAGVPVHVVSFSGTPGRFDAGDVRAMPRLRSLVREGEWDVVHAHSSKAGALVRASAPRGTPLVYTPHCFAFAARFGRAQRAAYWALEQSLMLRESAIVAACRWERDVAARSLWGARRRMRLIEHGVADCPPADPAPELIAFRGSRPLAGMVARLNAQKDPLTAVRAMRALAGRGDPPGRLAIVGNGPLREAVDAEVERLGLGAHVRCFEFDGRVTPYMRAFDVFVLSSRWESLPLGLLEAMRCGLPVVATSVGGVPDAVEEGVTGRLVAPGDPGQLGDRLGELLADAEVRARFAAAAAVRAATRFDVERMVDEVAELYREVGVRRAGARYPAESATGGRARPRRP
jgi:glycosyltransferase involved in cell wall biosynthesis